MVQVHPAVLLDSTNKAAVKAALSVFSGFDSNLDSNPNQNLILAS